MIAPLNALLSPSGLKCSLVVNANMDVQLLSDKTTIESGIIYTLEKGNHNGDYFKRNFDRVFMSKQELINSL